MSDSTIRRETEPPGQHFFGYYEKSPWDRTGRYLLAHRVAFADRLPAPDDEAEIRLIDTESGESERIGATTAWNFQLGSSLQWLGPEYDRRVAFNDREGDSFVARIVDVETGDRRTVDRPIYAVAPDGRTAFSLDFDRLYRTRRGYGYAPTGDRAELACAPDDEGIYAVDLATGAVELTVSLAELAAADPPDSMADGPHWVNHVQFDPTGSRVGFLHRWETPAADRGWYDRLFAMDVDGGDRRRLASGFASHYDWRTSSELVAWTREPETGAAFHRYDLRDGTVEAVAPETLEVDGHNSFSPDGRWMLTDTPPDEDRTRHLLLYDVETGRRHRVGSVAVPPVDDRHRRCDAHPRWDRDGRRVCFDSMHDGGRQLYAIDVSELTAPETAGADR